jgi:hypothetical protein
MTGRGHPVGRQLDVADVGDVGGGDVGERLADRHAAGGRRIDQAIGVRSPIAKASPVAVIAIAVTAHIGHRHLPRADHLVARGPAADRAVADGDQERLARDRRQAQHAHAPRRRSSR